MQHVIRLASILPAFPLCWGQEFQPTEYPPLPMAWNKILEYAERPYRVAEGAIGAILGDRDRLYYHVDHVAKLSDAAMARIVADSEYDWYRLSSRPNREHPQASSASLHLQTLRSEAVYNDEQSRMGFSSNSDVQFSRECRYVSATDWRCVWLPMLTNGGSLDTGEDDGCVRWFTDSRWRRHPVDCFTTHPLDLTAMRCWSSGDDCHFAMRTHVTLEKWGPIPLEQAEVMPLEMSEIEAAMVGNLEARYYGGVHTDYHGFAIPSAGTTVLRFSLSPFFELQEIDLSRWIDESHRFRGAFTMHPYAYLVPAGDEYPHGKVVQLNLDLSVDNVQDDDVLVWDLTRFDPSLVGFWGGFAHEDCGYLVPHKGEQYHGRLVSFCGFAERYRVLDLLRHDDDALGFAGGFVHPARTDDPNSRAYGILVPHETDLAVQVNLLTFQVERSVHLGERHFAEGFPYYDWDYFLPYMRVGPVVRVASGNFKTIEALDPTPHWPAGSQMPVLRWAGGFRDDFYGYLIPSLGDAFGRFPLADFRSMDFFQLAGDEGGGNPPFAHGFAYFNLGFMIAEHGPMLRVHLSSISQVMPAVVVTPYPIRATPGCAVRMLRGGRTCEGLCVFSNSFGSLVDAWNYCYAQDGCNEVLHRNGAYEVRSLEDVGPACTGCETYLQYCPDPKRQVERNNGPTPVLESWQDFPMPDQTCNVIVEAQHGMWELVEGLPQDSDLVYLDREYQFSAMGSFLDLAEQAVSPESAYGMWYLRVDNDLKFFDPAETLWTVTTAGVMTIYLDFWGGEDHRRGCVLDSEWVETRLTGVSFAGQGGGSGVVYARTFFSGESARLGACGYAGGMHLILITVRADSCIVHGGERAQDPPTPAPSQDAAGGASVDGPGTSDDVEEIAEQSTTTGGEVHGAWGGTSDTPAPTVDGDGDYKSGMLIASLLTLFATAVLAVFLANTYGSVLLGIFRQLRSSIAVRQVPSLPSAPPKCTNTQPRPQTAEEAPCEMASFPSYACVASSSSRHSVRSWSTSLRANDPFGAMFTGPKAITAIATHKAYALSSGKKYHFFVSHKKSHSAYHNTSEQISIYIKDALQVSGLRGFLDIDNLRRITEEDLRKAVIASCTMIVVLNDETVDSRWCLMEWDIAKAYGIPTVCVVDMEKFQKRVLLEQVANVCPHLMEHQWLDYTYQSRERSLKSLAKWMNNTLRMLKLQQILDEPQSRGAPDDPEAGFRDRATTDATTAALPGSEGILDQIPSTNTTEDSPEGGRLVAMGRSSRRADSRCPTTSRSSTTGGPIEGVKPDAEPPAPTRKHRWRRHKAKHERAHGQHTSCDEGALTDTTPVPSSVPSRRTTDDCLLQESLDPLPFAEEGRPVAENVHARGAERAANKLEAHPRDSMRSTDSPAWRAKTNTTLPLSVSSVVVSVPARPLATE